jgi:anthocyanidin 3-O-glucosyltransferase
MTQSQSATDPHVAVLAFPFTCHPWPLFNLACKLACAAPHIRFSFFNTSKSNRRLFETSQLAELPDNLKAYNVADGVPEGHVFTPANLDEEFELFMKAAPESFGKAMDIAMDETGRNISCFLSDCFLVFSCQMAEKMHVKWVPFWVPAPCSLLAQIYWDLIHKAYTNYACGINGGDVVGLGCIMPIDKTLDVIPGLSVKTVMRFCDLSDEVLQGDDPNLPLVSRNLYRMCEVLPQASAIVMNSFQELDSTLLTNDLKSKFQDILYVGFLTLPIPPPPLPPSHSDATGCLPWLDQQKLSSVAYISFGLWNSGSIAT